MSQFRYWFPVFLIFVAFSMNSAAAQATHYLVTNDDVVGANTATFYTLGGTPANPTLTQLAVVPTGGKGHGGGYFATPGVGVLRNPRAQCVYVTDSNSSDVTGIDLRTLTATGNFKGSRQDSGGLIGIGMVMNDQYLYVSFTGTFTIGAFQVMPGCTLQFLGDIDAIGQGLGSVDGMAIRGNLLVVAYADSTIESFDISSGLPVPNGDRMLSTGSKNGNLPAGVDITQDGHFAIFGDISLGTVVEVSDISSGKLTPTVVYTLGAAAEANDVFLSPDESLLYVANNKGGTVTAALFDKASGVVSPGCASPTLRGFNTKWTYTAGLATAMNTGTGQVLYVAEEGTQSGIGLVSIAVGGGSCRLTETPSSPVHDVNSRALHQLQSYPPRSF